jgi:hypothetical protein
MTRTNIRITELMTRLTALERERAAIIAEVETLQSAPGEQTAAIKVIRLTYSERPSTSLLGRRRPSLENGIELPKLALGGSYRIAGPLSSIAGGQTPRFSKAVSKASGHRREYPKTSKGDSVVRPIV